jgi:hypothetical protein
MLEPSQFNVNEAWIVFLLNDTPISTEADGDFNVVCLMDAASCYIFGNEFIPAHLTDVPEFTAKHLIEAGRSHAQVLPQKLLLSSELGSNQFVTLAEQTGIDVFQVSEEEISPFTTEAREGFQEYIGGGRAN